MDKVKVECRIFNFNIPLLVLLFILCPAICIVLIIQLYPGHHVPQIESDIFVMKSVGGMALAFVLPLILSSKFDYCQLTSDGIRITSAYLYGLFRIKTINPWSKAVSFDFGFVFNPLNPREVPQVKIFFKRGYLRLDPTNKNLTLNGEPTDWDHFKAEVRSLLWEAGVPQATPKSVASRGRTLRIGFLVVMISLGLLIIAGGIISIVAGKLPFQFIFAATMFFVIFAGAGARIFRK